MIAALPNQREVAARRLAKPFADNAELVKAHGKKIAIFIVSYNAVTTIDKVLARTPPGVYENITEILMFDDASQDATYDLAVGLKATRGYEKLQISKHPKNLGYGGNQKAGYLNLIERGFDVVVLLHGDGQYAPEFLPEMYHPIVMGEADAVFGSRMMTDHGGPLKGGMPIYKYLGNRILTELSNFRLDMSLTEFHSGYRAYNLHALKQIDFTHMTNDFHFDTEIIVKLHHQGFRITERAIPTYYGDEICYVNGFKYARNVVRALNRYKKTVASIKCFPEYQEFFVHYPIKESRNSSHEMFLRLTGRRQKVLDLGCGEGFFAEKLVENENTVVGVDVLDKPKRLELLKQYFSCPLDGGLEPILPELKKHSFDKVLLMDILEHLPRPEKLLEDCHKICNESTQLIASVPNVANITVRLALLFGQFNYTDRGILDKTHLRFWTRKTAAQMFRDAGFEIVREKVTVMPIELALGLRPRSFVAVALNRLLGMFTWMMPGLFGYQTVLVVRSRRV